MRTPVLLAAALFVLSACGKAGGEQVGSVDTVFQWLGPDHKIVVEAYDDPKVAGVTCYVSRAKTGGIKGGLGLAEDKSEASISCRQTGQVFAGGGSVPHSGQGAAWLVSARTTMKYPQ